MFETQRDSKI